jgi:hypothetical protein
MLYFKMGYYSPRLLKIIIQRTKFTDGMEAPVEKIAQDIVQRNIQQDIKRKYSLLMPLSIDDLKDVAAQCGKIRIDDFAMGGKSI